MGMDPGQIKTFLDTITQDIPDSTAVDREVRRAIESLTEEEMEFVIRFYFMGQSYREIAEKSGRPVHKLEALHNRAIKKLKSLLKSFVKQRYGVNITLGKPCPLCESNHREAIDKIIKRRKKNATWKLVIRELNKRYGFKIKAPSLLIGHEKYHQE